MAPNSFNILTGPLVEVMTLLRKSIPGGFYDQSMLTWLNAWTAGRQDRDYFAVEKDFSSMDGNYAVNLRHDLIDMTYENFGSSLKPWVRDLLKSHTHMPYLIPDVLDDDVNTYAGLAAVPHHQGAGLFSGLKLTSAIDSLGAQFYASTVFNGINKELMSERLKNPKESRMFVGNQGDDLFYFIDKSLLDLSHPAIAASFYKFSIERAARLGWSVKVVPGDVFLMKHMNSPNHNAPLLSRIIQQTVSNEHVRSDEETFVLGLAARTMNSEFIINFGSLKNQQRYPEMTRMFKRYVDFYFSTLEKTAFYAELKFLIKDSNNEKRMEVIRKISASLEARMLKVINALDLNTEVHKVLLNNPILQLLINDRYSSSTQNLILLLSQDKKIASLLDKISNKDVLLYDKCITLLNQKPDLNIVKRALNQIAQH